MVLPDDVDTFMGITSANERAARRILDLCGGDLEQAVQLWFGDEELQRSLSNPSPPPGAASSNAAATSRSSTRRNRPPVGREDAHGVIHIDSDDDDVQMTEDESFGQFDDSDDDAADAVNVARTAQEEEDAAMAKRLQEELYSGQTAVDEDGVRAPMARTTETLIGPGGGFSNDGDVEAAILDQIRRRRQPAARPRNPFAQSVWEEPASGSGSSDSPAAPSAPTSTSRSTRLADLFRPPYDIMFHESWDEARDLGKETKKWILVNLQDMSDFHCQALNRDLWKDVAIKEIIKENFIFLQYDKSEDNAEQYISFYFPNQSHENPSNYPHVSIIDPRTGEQVKVWSGLPFPTARDFYAQLVEFLDRYSLAANSKNPVPKTKRPERAIDVDRMTEEEMLQMAMQNSLESRSDLTLPNVVDPDELTKSVGDISADKGGKQVDPADHQAPEVEPTPEVSAFARIPSDRPHIEPASDPATTTRLQVRNPPARIIRRFRLDEPVSRIYEWLKAEPLPGKEGVEFELKSMPQGNDLIQYLDQTIKEAGLANGTVMIEFIED
ncbi:hypothetical protein B0T19DRAFT_395653 [Cercophora scortea]|uniref:UBX domain-containing protein n=1 Tax=Cercophora scortea TaxID=314031 RepID=A0AAE0MKU7_9PEZI|nr:hypothetical protein B0T19DRAFT_395653 [Cercophora scortea]